MSKCCRFFTHNWLRIAGQDLVYEPKYCPACGKKLNDPKNKMDKPENS